MAGINDIVPKLQSSEEVDIVLVRDAYEFAKKAHEGHKRYSGKPYITHLVAVAETLADMGMGAKTIAAGLLHDTVEDTTVTREEVREHFGDEVLFLVEGVTKLGSVRYYGTDRHNESLRKLFVATSEDIRVLIIKLADRLHNMQTLEHVPKEKQERIARETLEIYVPVAHRLGIGRIRKELEDLAFPYVYPDEYKKVEELVRPDMKRAIEKLEKARKTLQRRLAESGLTDFTTNSRVKGLYSLFRKLERRDWDLDKIYDLLAVRVIVSDVDTCYRVLGTIHDIWRPLPKRMKDYIAFPKPNGYRSIHTTVITGEETIIEVQIRTADMHREAEFGVASHLSYKTGEERSSTNTRIWGSYLIPSLFRPFSWKRIPSEKRAEMSPTKSKFINRELIPRWIQEIGEAHKEATNTGTFVQGLQEDFFSHRIFAFTPKGDVIDLPVGASPVDFAYAIHTDIGNHIAGVKINGKLVQLNTELKNGDIVEVETKKSNNPTPKWLEFAKTNLAQRRIRAALNQDES